MPRDPLLHPGRPEIDITGNGAPSPPPSIYTFKLTRWDEKAGLHGIRYAPNNRRAQSTRERRPAVKKISTVATRRNMIFNEPRLTIGMDLETAQAITALGTPPELI